MISMKGTDLSPEQMAHAESFLRECATPVPLIGAKTMLDVEHLIRLLAWYGAIRAKSGRLSQIAHAESFLRECATPVPLIGAKTMLDVEHLIRLLAWYGAIRAKSGRLS